MWRRGAQRWVVWGCDRGGKASDGRVDEGGGDDDDDDDDEGRRKGRGSRGQPSHSPFGFWTSPKFSHPRSRPVAAQSIFGLHQNFHIRGQGQLQPSRRSLGLHRNFHIRGQGPLQPSRFLDFTKILKKILASSEVRNSSLFFKCPASALPRWEFSYIWLDSPFNWLSIHIQKCVILLGSCF